MKITRIHPFTGKFNSVDLPITHEQLDAWKTGTLAQNAFPHLTADEREFLISGLVPGDWGKYMGEEEATS